MNRFGRIVVAGLALTVLCGLLSACRGTGRLDCEDRIWPGPRIGPTCRGLCREPQLEPPCP